MISKNKLLEFCEVHYENLALKKNAAKEQHACCHKNHLFTTILTRNIVCSKPNYQVIKNRIHQQNFSNAKDFR